MNNQKPIAIILDRLASALERCGVELPRNKLLEVAASAFGHRSSNETSMLSQQGMLTPPSAQPIGLLEMGADSVVIVRDPTTDMTYGISRTFLDGISTNRADQFAPCPYGGLNDLRRVALSEMPAITRPMPVRTSNDGEDWTAVVQVGEGFDGHHFFSERSAADLAIEIAAWCVEYWDDARQHGAGVPSAAERKTMTDLEVVETYFRAMKGREFLFMDGIGDFQKVVEKIREGVLEANAGQSATRIAATVRDGRFRAYPRTRLPADMPEEEDFLSSHDTLEEAIAACEANRVEHYDAAVADHVGRRYWRASRSWTPCDMPALAISGDPDVTTFHLDARDLLEDELADELHRIGDMIRNDGYREGETMHRGWWWRILSDKAAQHSEAGGSHGECRRCGCPLDVDGFCEDETCPFSDCHQDNPAGWAGHPQMDDGDEFHWDLPDGMTSLRAARIQHAVLVGLENGLIDDHQAALRLHRRLNLPMSRARAVVEGSDKGANR